MSFVAVVGSTTAQIAAGILTLVGSVLAAGSMALRDRPSKADVIETMALVLLGFGGSLAFWDVAVATGWLFYLVALATLALLILLLRWGGAATPESHPRLTRVMSRLTRVMSKLAIPFTVARRSSEDDDEQNQGQSHQPNQGSEPDRFG